MAKPKPSEAELKIRDIEWSFNKNSERVSNIIKVYDDHLKPAGKGRVSAVAQDVIRAGVVLLHASVEDLIRQSRIRFFSKADKSALDDIPLPQRKGKRPEQYKLGSLIDFKEETVANLIDRSIEEFYENYGSISVIQDLISGIQACGIEEFYFDYKNLVELISRRHNIVHKGDANRDAKGKGVSKIRSITIHELRDFYNDADTFAEKFLAELRKVHNS